MQTKSQIESSRLVKQPYFGDFHIEHPGITQKKAIIQLGFNLLLIEKLNFILQLWIHFNQW